MTSANALEQGRACFERHAWDDAYRHLSAVDADGPLGPEDLERLATAAYLTGRDDDSARYWARAHSAYVDSGEAPRGARCAFWLAFGLLNRGEHARGGGWLTRARRLLEGRGECVEHGYLLLPTALRHMAQGSDADAYAAFGRAAGIGQRFGDPGLVTLSRIGEGQTLIRLGRVDDGITLLDEAMVAVEADADRLSPIVVGTAYCAAIEACQEIFDHRRAQEWTLALGRWCESQPELVPFRGQCQVRRAEIMQLHGAWPDAIEQARLACEELSRPPAEPAAGAAFYQLGELHRLAGRFAEAEDAYRQADRWGRTPQPGLALLWLAQGRADVAAATIRRLADEAEPQRIRSRILPAYVEIVIAVGDVAAARAAADELSAIADRLDAPLLRALSAHVSGAVLLAEGNHREALASLRRAATVWQEIEAPYEDARTRVLIGLALRELGDGEAAAMALDTAQDLFRQLGAGPDVARVERLRENAAPAPHHGLTRRERQVLRLVAAGGSNRLIASELSISERTVERHVSHIFTKLGVSSRTAATAYAYEHGML